MPVMINERFTMKRLIVVLSLACAVTTIAGSRALAQRLTIINSGTRATYCTLGDPITFCNPAGNLLAETSVSNILAFNATAAATPSPSPTPTPTPKPTPSVTPTTASVTPSPVLITQNILIPSTSAGVKRTQNVDTSQKQNLPPAGISPLGIALAIATIGSLAAMTSVQSRRLKAILGNYLPC